MRKEHARDGKRKDIIQSDEEEDSKKVSCATIVDQLKEKAEN